MSRRPSSQSKKSNHRVPGTLLPSKHEGWQKRWVGSQGQRKKEWITLWTQWAQWCVEVKEHVDGLEAQGVGIDEEQKEWLYAIRWHDLGSHKVLRGLDSLLGQEWADRFVALDRMFSQQENGWVNTKLRSEGARGQKDWKEWIQKVMEVGVVDQLMDLTRTWREGGWVPSQWTHRWLGDSVSSDLAVMQSSKPSEEGKGQKEKSRKSQKGRTTVEPHREKKGILNPGWKVHWECVQSEEVSMLEWLVEIIHQRPVKGVDADSCKVVAWEDGNIQEYALAAREGWSRWNAQDKWNTLHWVLEWTWSLRQYMVKPEYQQAWKKKRVEWSMRRMDLGHPLTTIRATQEGVMEQAMKETKKDDPSIAEVPLWRALLKSPEKSLLAWKSVKAVDNKEEMWRLLSWVNSMTIDVPLEIEMLSNMKLMESWNRGLVYRCGWDDEKTEVHARMMDWINAHYDQKTEDGKNPLKCYKHRGVVQALRRSGAWASQREWVREVNVLKAILQVDWIKPWKDSTLRGVRSYWLTDLGKDSYSTVQQDQWKCREFTTMRDQVWSKWVEEKIQPSRQAHVWRRMKEAWCNQRGIMALMEAIEQDKKKKNPLWNEWEGEWSREDWVKAAVETKRWDLLWEMEEAWGGVDQEWVNRMHEEWAVLGGETAEQSKGLQAWVNQRVDTVSWEERWAVLWECMEYKDRDNRKGCLKNCGRPTWKQTQLWENIQKSTGMTGVMNSVCPGQSSEADKAREAVDPHAQWSVQEVYRLIMVNGANEWMQIGGYGLAYGWTARQKLGEKMAKRVDTVLNKMKDKTRAWTSHEWKALHEMFVKCFGLKEERDYMLLFWKQEAERQMDPDLTEEGRGSRKKNQPPSVENEGWAEWKNAYGDQRVGLCEAFGEVLEYHDRVEWGWHEWSMDSMNEVMWDEGQKILNWVHYEWLRSHSEEGALLESSVEKIFEGSHGEKPVIKKGVRRL